jgi:hypothetical protein
MVRAQYMVSLRPDQVVQHPKGPDWGAFSANEIQVHVTLKSTDVHEGCSPRS